MVNRNRPVSPPWHSTILVCSRAILSLSFVASVAENVFVFTAPEILPFPPRGPNIPSSPLTQSTCLCPLLRPSKRALRSCYAPSPSSTLLPGALSHLALTPRAADPVCAQPPQHLDKRHLPIPLRQHHHPPTQTRTYSLRVSSAARLFRARRLRPLGDLPSPLAANPP